MICCKVMAARPISEKIQLLFLDPVFRLTSGAIDFFIKILSIIIVKIGDDKTIIWSEEVEFRFWQSPCAGISKLLPHIGVQQIALFFHVFHCKVLPLSFEDLLIIPANMIFLPTRQCIWPHFYHTSSAFSADKSHCPPRKIILTFGHFCRKRFTSSERIAQACLAASIFDGRR